MKIPEQVTRYMFTDPAGARNWATLWVAVDKHRNHYIYRDWPDLASYGEWATPSEDPKQPDGDAGKAQKSLGLGVESLKAEWLRLENGEVIFQRFIDPRAGRNPHMEEHGGTCLIDQFMEGTVPMVFTPANAGDRIMAGINLVNDLLFWNREKPLCAVTNAPKLFVTENCQQVMWMLSNYTGRGGEKGGCKDFADLVRYMALADLQFVGDTTLRSWGGGSY